MRTAVARAHFAAAPPRCHAQRRAVKRAAQPAPRRAPAPALPLALRPAAQPGCRAARTRAAASPRWRCAAASNVLDLTEENVDQVLLDAREELSQMFDEELGMTGAKGAACKRESDHC